MNKTSREIQNDPQAAGATFAGGVPREKREQRPEEFEHAILSVRLYQWIGNPEKASQTNGAGDGVFQHALPLIRSVNERNTESPGGYQTPLCPGQFLQES